MNADNNRSGLEPFYFMSYDRVIGVARNVNDLREELARLSEENPEALEYHIKQGQIASWLNYANEKELAEELKGVKGIEETKSIVNQHISKGESTPRTIDSKNESKKMNRKKPR